MPWAPRAITLDLDDTLWPIAPAIDRAEAALETWLREHAPRAALRWPLEARRALRDRVQAEHPELAHDFSAQRQLTLAHMLADADEDPALVPTAFEAYFAARCQVDLYADARAALDRLSARLPLAAISNGNACLVRIGLMAHFDFQLAAREHGCGKPDAGIFLAACARLGLHPHEVLHVGDDPAHDVIGARAAGLRSAWINRDRRAWPDTHPQPELAFADLHELADWLDARLPARTEAAASATHRIRSTA
ncbi:MAG: HAD family hydrolase [Proteobacteria bacterium]|nr:HAD family hydrolase [Pseudomonadota bacterium]